MSDTTRALIGRVIQAPAGPARATHIGSIARPPATVREMLGRIIAPGSAPRTIPLDIPIAVAPEAARTPAGHA